MYLRFVATYIQHLLTIKTSNNQHEGEIETFIWDRLKLLQTDKHTLYIFFWNAFSAFDRCFWLPQFPKRSHKMYQKILYTFKVLKFKFKWKNVKNFDSTKLDSAFKKCDNETTPNIYTDNIFYQFNIFYIISFV
jgi:hypothetical protein